MAKYKFPKKFSLSFLGEEWKECFIEFNSLTIRDLRDELSGLTKVDKDNAESVSIGIEGTIKVLEARFIKGMALDENAKLIEIKKEELVDLPAEVLMEALNFLSQGLAPKKEE